jgi:two-component system sensor histidine kinase GlrK
VQLVLTAAGAAWTVRVGDEGPGVPAEKRDTVFEPFFTTKEKGTGLGLAFARQLAEAHRGRLELLPTGPGAQFVLTVPTTPTI